MNPYGSIPLYEKARAVKPVEIKNRVVFPRAGGWVGIICWWVQVSFWHGEIVLKLDYDDGYTMTWICLKNNCVGNTSTHTSTLCKSNQMYMQTEFAMQVADSWLLLGMDKRQKQMFLLLNHHQISRQGKKININNHNKRENYESRRL